MSKYFWFVIETYDNHFEVGCWLFGNWIEITIELNYDGYHGLIAHLNWIKRAYNLPIQNLDDIPF